jgi:hypothetical protein
MHCLLEPQQGLSWFPLPWSDNLCVVGRQTQRQKKKTPSDIYDETTLWQELEVLSHSTKQTLF